MASDTHEGLVALFRESPSLTADSVRWSGLEPELPGSSVAVSVSENLSLGAKELRPDAVVVLREGDVDRLAVVVEVQLKKDDRKRRSWPLYEAAAAARHDCPTLLLVVAPRPEVAAWAEQPIVLGNSGSVRPLVLQPAQVPRITDLDEAERNPHLAVLSAVMHGRGPPDVAARVAIAAEYAVRKLPGQKQLLYFEVIEHELGRLGSALMEAIVSQPGYEWRSEFARRHRGEGRAEGRQEGREEGLQEGRQKGARETLVRLLGVKFGDVPERYSARIKEAAFVDLERWSVAVLTAGTLEEVFAASEETKA